MQAQVDIVLCGMTALRFWRAVGTELVREPEKATRVPVTGSIPQTSGILKHPVLAAISADGPYNLLVDNATGIHRCGNVRFHSLGTAWDTTLLRQIDTNLYVVSPELAFVQLCTPGQLLPAIELLMELCGHYSLAPDGSGSFASHDALTTVARVNDVIAGLGRRVGITTARQAVALALDGAASPRETAIAIIETLGARRGGYGMAKPTLNWRIDINAVGRTYTDALFYVADECWPEVRVILEYDSDTHHLYRSDGSVNEAKVRADRERHEALEAMGYVIITITTDHTKSFAAFDRKMHQLAQAIGTPLPHASDQLQQRRQRLQRWLFNPAHHAANDRLWSNA